MEMKDFVKAIPIVGGVARKVYRSLRHEKRLTVPFHGSEDFWEARYARGDNSGVGSYGKFAQFKAEVLNKFVRDENIASVIEFGCGDGNQLMQAAYPRYTGVDVSETAIAQCREKFRGDATKSFLILGDYSGETAEVAMSLDVIYHLVEDAIFDSHMRALFGAATRFVIIYSSNTDDNAGNAARHVRHRKFTDWIEVKGAGWSLDRHIPNKYPYAGDYTQGSFADFYIYKNTG